MNQLFLIFETRGVRSSELDKLIKINGFVQAIKDTARVELILPRSSYYDSGKYLPEVDLSGVDQVIVLGSTYSEIFFATLMRLSDANVPVLVIPELLAFLDSNTGTLHHSMVTILGEDCIAEMKDFIS